MDLSRSHLPLNDSCHRDGTIAPGDTMTIRRKRPRPKKKGPPE
jgi:hypothetical protein